MLADVECVSEAEDASTALARLDALGLHTLPVCDAGGTLVGVLYRIERSLSQPRLAGQLAARVEPLDHSQALEDALASFERQQTGWLPVVKGDKPVGIAGRGEIAAHLEIDRELGPAVLEVSQEVSPDDAMLALDHSWSSYLSNASSALRCIRRSMRVAEKHQVRSIFDLACGHGRVLRVLKVAFPEARLTACDINVDGVEFCARVLGAVPIVSHVKARDIDVPGTFDLVWSGSLFNHFDVPRWDEFLDLVEAALEPGGLFVMAIHSRQFVEGMRQGIPDPKLSRDGIERIVRGYDRTGFGYADYAGKRDWGDNVAKPEWVEALIKGRKGLDLLDYQESEWSNALDVVTCVRRSNPGSTTSRRGGTGTEG
jgi:SAM-dependent methyltransferase